MLKLDLSWGYIDSWELSIDNDDADAKEEEEEEEESCLQRRFTYLFTYNLMIVRNRRIRYFILLLQNARAYYNYNWPSTTACTASGDDTRAQP